MLGDVYFPRWCDHPLVVCRPKVGGTEEGTVDRLQENHIRSKLSYKQLAVVPTGYGSALRNQIKMLDKDQIRPSTRRI